MAGSRAEREYYAAARSPRVEREVMGALRLHEAEEHGCPG